MKSFAFLKRFDKTFSLKCNFLQFRGKSILDYGICLICPLDLGIEYHFEKKKVSKNCGPNIFPLIWVKVPKDDYSRQLIAIRDIKV